MATTNRFAPLIGWRKRMLPLGVLPVELVDLLSVEGVEKQGVQVPQRLRKDLTAFRKLRQDARLAAIRSLHADVPKKAKPPKEPKEGSTIIAVYGYVSQRFDSAKDAEEWLRDRIGRGTVPRGFLVQGKVKTIEKIFKK